MKVDQLIPLPTKKCVFTLSHYKRIPNAVGCYIISNYENDIIYVGLSNNLQRRFCQHLENPDKTSIGIYGRPTWYYYLFSSENELEKIERTWLNQYQNVHGCMPVLNKVASPLQ